AMFLVQAEDGIRDSSVTGVQTCALPISDDLNDDGFRDLTGMLTFAPGEVSKTIIVQIIGDTIRENKETLTLRLSNPNNAVIGNRSEERRVGNANIARRSRRDQIHGSENR